MGLSEISCSSGSWTMILFLFLTSLLNIVTITGAGFSLDICEACFVCKAL